MKTFLCTNRKGLSRAACVDNRWQVEFMLDGQDVHCLAAHPHDSGIVYAGTRTNGVLRSSDGGRSWAPAGLRGASVKALAVSKAEPGVVYAGTKPVGLFVSRDGGGHWDELESLQRMRLWWWFSPAESDLRAYVQAIALSPVEPDVILAGIEAGGVLRSADGGRTWRPHGHGAILDCHSLTAHASDSAWMYQAGGNGAGVAVSRDAGVTWRQLNRGLDRHYGWACAADPAQPTIWYASLSPMFTRKQWGAPAAHVDGHANAAVFRASGDGEWRKLGGGLPQPLDYMAYALLTDPAAPGHLYAGLSNGDVWHTTDHGESWSQLPFNMRSIHRSMIMV